MGIRGSRYRKTIIGAVLILVLGLLIAGCGEKKVASVNGEAISQKEFEKRMSTVQTYYESTMGMTFEGENGAAMLQNLRNMVLDQLVTEHLLQQEARKRDLKAAKEEVQQRIEQDKLMVGGEEAYLEILKNQVKMTEQEYQSEVEKQIVIEKLFEQVVAGQTVSPEEVQQYYEENKESYNQTEQIRARHILVETEEEAKELIEQLKAGADFGQIALEKSTDPSAKENQGDLGYFDRNAQLVSEFKDAAFKLQVGEMTAKPVKTEFGYHIIKVEDLKPAGQLSFEEVKDSISEELISGKEGAIFQEFLEGLRNQAKIEKEESSEPTAADPPQAVDSPAAPAQ